jgi:DNA polymerase-1
VRAVGAGADRIVYVTTLLAIDGTNLLYRAYHALAETDRGLASGEPNWVVGSFVDTVARLAQTHRPTSIIIALDGEGGCPSRKVLAPEYKAGRATTPEVLTGQLRAATEIFSDLGIASRMVPEWEADDVLATLATLTNARGARCVIVTSDKDAHQLVGGTVSVYKPEGVLVSNESLLAKYGVDGTRWVEFAAMCGEKSDNLPGVMGVGPKKAAQIISSFADVEDALANNELSSERLGARLSGMLVGGADAFRRNRQVGTLRRDLEISLDGIQLARLNPEDIELAGEKWSIARAGRNLARVVGDLQGS